VFQPGWCYFNTSPRTNVWQLTVSTWHCCHNIDWVIGLVVFATCFCLQFTVVSENKLIVMPHPNRWGHKAMMLSDVCLTSVEPKSRTAERPWKIKIGTEVAHVTLDSDTTLKVKRSKKPGRFARGYVGASSGCSGGRGNVLAMGNCCYVPVCSAAQGASAPTGEERGGGISWRQPAYSLNLQQTTTTFILCCVTLCR